VSEIGEIMALGPVIPVLVIDDPASARPIAEALLAGGLRVLEVTLRTAAALEVIREIASIEGVVLGAGTVLNPVLFHSALDAGAQFIVSPGLTEPLALAAKETRTPYLPGVATAGEVMFGLDFGFEHFKFFPAEASGGVRALSALAAPFAKARFCPTGGVTAANAADWLTLESVLCVGGSWLAPAGSSDFDAIRRRAQEATVLRRPAGQAG
jgi:2-dehydro-3-deoxyphosphogluconate aldolase/(4S)-4-hydroxy-2-oxoglutarate aldolase